MTLTSEQIESIRRGFDLMSRGLLARTYRPDLLNALCDMALVAAPESAVKEAQILKSLLNHWTEFGPAGMDEAVEYASKALAALHRDKPQPHEEG